MIVIPVLFVFFVECDFCFSTRHHGTTEDPQSYIHQKYRANSVRAPSIVTSIKMAKNKNKKDKRIVRIPKSSSRSDYPSPIQALICLTYCLAVLTTHKGYKFEGTDKKRRVYKRTNQNQSEKTLQILQQSRRIRQFGGTRGTPETAEVERVAPQNNDSVLYKKDE
jgi:hypothetical protein